GPEDHAHALFEPQQSVFLDETKFGRGPRDHFRGYAAAIVRYYETSATALRAGPDADHAKLVLARASTLVRRLDSMIDRVAHQVQQRIGDRVAEHFIN